MPLSNTTQTFLRGTPYWDDYEREKNFHRVLIKPRVPVQTRELNQMQSILQNQVEQVTSSIYREGAASSGGQQTVSGTAVALQVVRQDSVDVRNFYNTTTNQGALVKGTSSNAQAVVVQVSTGSGPYATVVVSPLNAETFEPNETVQFVNATNGDAIASMAMSPRTPTPASTFSVDTGVFFLRGHLVEVPKQTVVLSTTTASPSARVGFVVSESVVTAAMDGSLLDPALGSTNYAAPGADRLKITATLSSRAITDNINSPNADEGFVEIARLIDGVLQPHAGRLQQDFIEDTLARRTYDESGDYVVTPFRLQVKDHNPAVGVPNITGRISGNTSSTIISAASTPTQLIYANGVTRTVTTLFTSEVGVNDVLVVGSERRTITSVTNNTILIVNAAFSQDFTNSIATVVSEDKLNLELSAGKAYVRGYEIQTNGTTKLTADRARTTEDVNNGTIGVNYGPYLYVTRESGLFNINTMELADLHCVPSPLIQNATETKYSASRIGSARVRSFAYHTGWGDADTVYKMYLVGAEFESKTFTVNAAASSNTQLKTVAANAAERTLTLTQVATDNNITILAFANDAYTGALVTVGTTQGYNTTYPVMSSNTTLLGNSRVVVLKVAGDDILSYVNTSASVTLTFSDKCIRGLVDSNAKSKAVSTHLKSKVGQFTSNANTVLFGTSETSLLFKYRDGVIDPSTITDETFSILRYITNISGSSQDGFDISISGNEQTPLTQTDDVWVYMAAALSSNNKSVILSGSSVDTDADMISLDGLSTTVLGTGAPSTTTTIDVYAPVSVNNSNPRLKTRLTGNTNVSSIWTNSVALFSSLANGQIAINTINANSSRVVGLGVADVYNVSKVYAVTDPSSPITAAKVVDVTDRYTLDTGQRDWCYDHASLVLKQDSVHYTTNCHQYVVVIDRFVPSAASANALNYFTPASYSGMSIEDIPVFVNPKTGTSIPLATHVDFRPMRTANLTFANTATNPYVSNTATFESTALPIPNSTYRADYAFYLSRVDRLVLTKDRQFRLIKGVAGTQPTVPDDVSDGITLYVLTYPPYTAHAESVLIRPFEYKRYTMKDIRTLEKRIENLEYYTTLSVLDLQALNMVEESPDGNPRFKNGIITDTFASDAVVDFKNPGTKIQMDQHNAEMRPSSTTRAYRFHPTLTDAQNVQGLGTQGLISVTHTSVPFITQGLASKSININPFNVFSWTGTLNLMPSADTWVDTITRPDLVINMFNENDGYGAYDPLGREFVDPPHYNTWSTVVYGTPTLERERLMGWLPPLDNPANPQPPDGWSRSGLRLQEYDAIYLTTPSSTVTYQQSVQKHTSITFSETDKGMRIIDASVAPYMRGTDIDIVGTGLLPDSDLRATFDDVDVTPYIERANEIHVSSSNAQLFRVGDRIVSNAGGRARVIGVTSNSSLGVLHVADTRGVFGASTINVASTTAYANFEQDTARSVTNVPVVNYIHRHGRVESVTYDTAWKVNLGSGASSTASDYVGQVIHFTDGGYNSRFDLLTEKETATTPSGVAGVKATISAYNIGTKVATLTSLPADAVAAFTSQQTAFTTDHPIRYSIGVPRSSGSGASVAVSPGSFYGMFRLPGYRQLGAVEYVASADPHIRVRSGPLQFNAGSRLFKLTNISNATDSSAFKPFVSQGSTVVQQKDVVRTRQVDTYFEAGKVVTTVDINEPTRVFQRNEFVSYVDPLAQTFLVDKITYPEGVFITGVDLFFASKGSTGMDVEVQLRPTVNGYPSADVVLASAKLSEANITVVPANETPTPGKQGHYTRFMFPCPQYLAPNFEYSLVVLSNSNEYSVYVAEIGKKLIGTDRIIAQQPLGGSLFKSQNARTWVPEQMEDLMFEMHRAHFDTVQATLTCELGDDPSKPEAVEATTYDTLYAPLDYLLFPSTTVSSTFTPVTLTGSTAVYSLRPHTNMDMPERMKIDEGVPGSLKYHFKLRTTNPHVAPVLDMDNMTAVCIRNRVDNGCLYANGFVFTPGVPNTSASANYSVNGNTYTLTVTGGNGANAVFQAVTSNSGYVVSITTVENGYGYTETPTVVWTTSTDFTTQPTFTYVGETSPRPNIRGEQKARYITRPVTLADGFDASDLKVYIDAVRGPQHNIDVYYKVLATGDLQTFEDKSWTLMTLKKGTEQYSLNANHKREYEYVTMGTGKASYTSNGVTFDRFHTFAIKIVLRSFEGVNPKKAGTIIVPRVSNLRVLAFEE